MSMSLSTSPISATTVEFLVSKKLDGLNRSPTPLGENLVQAGLLTTGDLEAALTQHSSRQSQLGETLLEMGFVEEDTLLLFLGQQLAVPSVRLRSGLVDPNIVRKISETARRTRAYHRNADSAGASDAISNRSNASALLRRKLFCRCRYRRS